MNSVFLIPVVAIVSVFTFVAIAAWSDNRRKEREAYYRHETLRKLSETGGDSAESVRLVLRPVRIMGAVTEMEIEVTGSLPGDPDRLLLSRRETLVSNRGTLSAITVTSGKPPAGYRFAITPDF